MAIYHASFKIVKRSDGKSVVAAAAYRSGKKFYDEREDKVHNYQRKERVLSHKVMLCKNAPAKWKDAERLWNDVEASEKSSRAQLARNCDFALPRELNEKERAELIEDYVKRNFVDRGMCAQVDIHTTKGDNPHAHVLLTMRAVDENGNFLPKQRSEFILDDRGERIPILDPKTGKQKINKKQRGMKMWKRQTVKTTDWDEKETLMEWRRDWAESVNRALQKANVRDEDGNYVTITEKSLKEQGIDRAPTRHEGPNVRNMEKRGIATRIRSYNEAIRDLDEVQKTEAENTEKMSELERQEAELIRQEAETKRREQQLKEDLRLALESLRRAQEIKREEERKAELWNEYVKGQEATAAAQSAPPPHKKLDFTFSDDDGSHLQKLRDAAEHPNIAPTKTEPETGGYWRRIEEQYRKEHGLAPKLDDGCQQASGIVVLPSEVNDTGNHTRAATRPLGHADERTGHAPAPAIRGGNAPCDSRALDGGPTRAGADDAADRNPTATMNDERSARTLPPQSEPRYRSQPDDRTALAADDTSQRDDHSSLTPAQDGKRHPERVAGNMTDGVAGGKPDEREQQRQNHQDTHDEPQVPQKTKPRRKVSVRHRSNDRGHGMSR